MSIETNIFIFLSHGLIVDTELMPATGWTERDAAIAMLERLPGSKRISLGEDKLYDTKEFVAALRRMEVTPHVAQNTTNRRSAIDGRTMCHPNYRLSLKIRKRVEEIFEGMKTVGSSGIRDTSERRKSPGTSV